MKQAAASRRKGVVGKTGKKTPAVARPTERKPADISNHLRSEGLFITPFRVIRWTFLDFPTDNDKACRTVQASTGGGLYDASTSVAKAGLLPLDGLTLLQL
jgi:hypothetical protein